MPSVVLQIKSHIPRALGWDSDSSCRFAPVAFALNLLASVPRSPRSVRYQRSETMGRKAPNPDSFLKTAVTFHDKPAPLSHVADEASPMLGIAAARLP